MAGDRSTGGRSQDRGRGQGGGRTGGGGGGRREPRRDERRREEDDRSQTPRGVGGRPPAGIERATRSAGAPPRPPRSAAPAPPKPELVGEVTVSRGIQRELSRLLRNDRGATEVAVALSRGAEAIDHDAPEDALPYLRWAKHRAARSVTVREALGVALYLAEEYAEALSELQAYHRISGRADQNHLIADCLRATDRGRDRIPALIEELLEDREAPLDRRIEGVIVWAADLADRGDPGAGRVVLDRGLALLPGGEPDEMHLRVWYVAGDLAERADDVRLAREWFERIVAVDDGFHDVEDRLSRLA